VFTLNDNTQQIADSGSGSCPDLFTFNTATGDEFAGFYIQDANKSGEITRLAVYY